MTTSRFDLAYGRQGGRIVPWSDPGSRFHAGQLVRLLDPALNGEKHAVTVLEVMSGQRVRVTYGSVADLIVPATMLEPVRAGFRNTDGHTSEAAAMFQDPVRLSKGRREVLHAIVMAGDRGLTDFEIADRTGRKQTSHGKRRGELRDHALVEWTGETRPSDTGAQAKVWRATALGIQIWRQNIGKDGAA